MVSSLSSARLPIHPRPSERNSWNHFGCHGLNEDVIKGIADAFVSTGLKDCGYEYINLDGKKILLLLINRSILSVKMCYLLKVCSHILYHVILHFYFLINRLLANQSNFRRSNHSRSEQISERPPKFNPIRSQQRTQIRYTRSESQIDLINQLIEAGLYTDRGLYTCQHRPGAYGHEEIDAKTYGTKKKEN